MAAVFHAGEIAVQEQAGTYQSAGRIGSGIRAEIPASFREFMQEQVLAIAASVDATGSVWTSALVGEPGFLKALDGHTILIDAQLTIGDPLAANLEQPTKLGLVVIDLATRGRIRLNGTAVRDGNRIHMSTEEVFGNCQKYIQSRTWGTAVGTEASAEVVYQGSGLTDTQVEWIRGSDTFFVASANPAGGADASHRGGLPGFVHVHDAQTLIWPDYAGNGMFQTLGNLTLYPQAGLLFIDFERGHVLQITGRSKIIWDAERLAQFAGAERLVELQVDQVIETHNAIPLRFALQDYSRFNPR